MQTFSPEMMQRAARRQSGWNFLLILFALIGGGLAFFCILHGFLAFRQSFIPGNAFLMNGTKRGNTLLLLSCFVLSIVSGLILGNYCVWLIPPARRALSSESEGYRGTDVLGGNKELARGLVKVLIVCLPLGLLASTRYFYLTDSAIAYRPTILQPERSYQWSELAAVETSCWYSSGKGSGWKFSYKLVVRDGTKVDLSVGPFDFESAPRHFVRIYPVLAPVLARQSYVFDSHDVSPACEPEELKLILTSSPATSEIGK
jgi:hypothetical protein